MNIKQVPANPSRYSQNAYPKLGVVMHWMVGTLASTDRLFQRYEPDPKKKSSAHYGIGADGTIHQYVPYEMTAFHAGGGIANRHRIGIEHEGGHLRNGRRVKPTAKCHEASAQLIAYLKKTKGLPVILEPHNKYTATQCPGTLDIAWIENRVNQILSNNEMIDLKRGWNYLTEKDAPILDTKGSPTGKKTPFEWLVTVDKLIQLEKMVIAHVYKYGEIEETMQECDFWMNVNHINTGTAILKAIKKANSRL